MGICCFVNSDKYDGNPVLRALKVRTAISWSMRSTILTNEVHEYDV